MSAMPEKRRFERTKVEAPIIFKDSYIKKAYYGAMMKNCSVSGLYFESNYLPISGSDIFVESLNSPDLLKNNLNHNSRAKIVWCKKIANSGSSRYGVGVQYYKPFVN